MNIELKCDSAEGLEAYFSSEKTKRLEMAEGNIKVKASESNQGFGLRILHKGRIGFSYFSAEKDYAKAFGDAREVSKYSEKTGFKFSGKRKYPKVKSFSERVADIDLNEMKEIILQMNDVLIKNGQHGRIILEASNAEIEISNTSDLNAKSAYSNFSAYCETMKKDGFGFAYHSGVELLRTPVDLAVNSSDLCNEMIGAKKIPGGEYQIVFSPEAINSMLDILLPSISGDWKRKDMSKLSNMTGKRIFSETLSIIEDSSINASRASAFDGEGVPAKRIPIVEKGVLKNFIYDRETAALEGVTSEGCCSRASYQAKPHVSTSNIEISSGNWNSFESELDEFVLVRSVHGVHTSNITTGDFGVEANTAFIVRNGKKQATRGFIISGNIFTMLNNILGIEKKTKICDNLISPNIAIEKLRVIG